MKNKLVLNPYYCNNGHVNEMINRTLPHEIAHLVSFKKFGNYGREYGPNWKYVMRLLGLTPTRCHSYDLEGVKVRKGSETNFVYKCNCRNKIFLTQIRHNRHQSRRQYHCLMCKTTLQLIGDMNKKINQQKMLKKYEMQQETTKQNRYTPFYSFARTRYGCTAGRHYC